MFKLIKARIQRNGFAHYGVLPKQWMEKHNLRKRDSIIISIDSENRLIIEPEVQSND